MNRLLVVLLLLVIGVVGLGFYLGWFQIATDREDQKHNIKFTIDEDKIKKDKEKAMEKVHEAEKYMKDKTQGETKKEKEKESQP